MDNFIGTGKVVGALVIGALVGSVLGVLFAPDKGSRTRSKIMDGAKDLANDVKSKISDEVAALRKKADELEEIALEKAGDALHNMKNKAEEAKKNHK